MEGVCNIFGKCRNRKTGQITNKTSLLHKDLLSIGKQVSEFDRKKANRAFFLSQTDKFLKDFDEELIFDSDAVDAEPILASFYEAARTIMPEVKASDIRDILAKKFGEGVYSYEEAYLKMLDFNQKMLGAHTFMGTIELTEGGKYRFRIAFNAIEEQNALVKTIANREAALTLLTQLEKSGVTASGGQKSLYSTLDPVTILNGSKELLKLIEVKGGIENIHDFAKETGHFVVGALGESNPLYQRLWTVVEAHPEMVNELLGEDEYLLYSQSPNKTIEFMGHLVGKYLEELSTKLDKNFFNTFKRLLARAIEYVKTKLPFTNREYNKAIYDAKYTAYIMAKSFMGDNFEGSLDSALERKETLEGNLNELLGVLNGQIRGIHLFLNKTKGIDYTLTKNYKEMFESLVTSLRKHSTLANEAEDNIYKQVDVTKNAVDTFLRLARFMTNEVSLATRLLLETNMKIINGEDVSYATQANVIKYNQEVHTLCNNLLKVQGDIINLMFKENLDGDTKDLVTEARDVFNLLHEMNTGFYTELIGFEESNRAGSKQYTSYEAAITAARRNLAVRLLASVNGNQFVAIALHMSIKNGKLERHKRSVKDIGKEILDTDINPPGQWISRWIDSMADNPDIINQLIYDIIEQKKHEANKRTLDMKDRLVDMYRELKNLKIKDTKIFYEVDNEGHLTGNLISERNWGLWEKDYEQEKEAFNNSYWNANKDFFNGNKSEMFHNNRYLSAFSKWRQEWHDSHSTKIPVLDKDGRPRKNSDGTPIKIVAPAISSDENATNKVSYDSGQYADFIETYGEDSPQVKWLNNFMKLKLELDSCLPFGATNMSGVRAPLFMGLVTNRFSNAFSGDGSIKRIFGIPLRKYIQNAVLQSPDDVEFGGEHDTYNDSASNEDPAVIFDKKHINALNQINRLPMYGVRKLKKLDDLSTDLISSTLAYASMAYNYDCLQEVVGAVEQIYTLKGEQKVDSDIPINELKSSQQPSSYARLSDYMMQLVYNNYCDGRVQWKILRKIGNQLSKLGSLYFLGFNLHSAITNAYTGWNEMVKEATGEDYNIKNFYFANVMYAGYWILGFLLNVCNIALAPGSDLESHTKMDLFLRMFDAHNENERKARDWNIGSTGYGLFRGRSVMNLAMLPYSITDQWMLSIAFLASARHTTLIKRTSIGTTGEYTESKSTLWNAYTVKDGKLVLKGNPKEWYIKDKNLEGILKVLSKVDPEKLTISEKLAIYQTNDSGDLIKDANDKYVLKDVYVPFDSRQENLFRIRCRAINNRMHGVYNKGDGGAYLGLALGGPIASLKKYAIGLIDRRFSRVRYDSRKKDFVQGSYISLGNLVWDCFTVYNSESNLDTDTKLGVLGKLANRLDSMGYINKNDKNEINAAKTVMQVIGKLLWGIAKISYIGSTGAVFNREYLRNRGFSENQITNIARVWGDMMIPFQLQLLMAICAPPDEPEEEGLLNDALINPLRHTLGFNGMEPSWFSDKMTDFYLWALNSPFMPGDKTIADDSFLSKDYFVYLHIKKHGAPPFSFLGILYYQTYRAFLEQTAFNIAHPGGMLSEFKSLTSSALPAATALGDIGILIGQMSEAIGLTSKSADDLAEMAIKEGSPSPFKRYYDGKEIYLKGNNAHWYKWSRHFLKVGPLRTGAMWEDGYTSKESMEYFRGQNKDGIDKFFASFLDWRGWAGGAGKDTRIGSTWTETQEELNN